MPTYNQRLTANNQKIDEITTLANTLPPAGGSSEPNIFLQDTEPTKKQGIWLKMSDTTAEHYVSDKDIYTGTTWSAIDETTLIPYRFYNGSAVAVGTDIYLLGGYESLKYTYKYNTLTDTYTQLANIPYNFSSSSAATVGTNIYLFGSRIP